MPTTAAVGAKLTASIWNADVEAPLAAWTSWVTTWASTGTAVVFGNGTVGGYYMQDGKSVTATFWVFSGSTTTYGTGNYSFSLPVTAHASYIAEVAMGTAAVRRSTRYSGTLIFASTTTVLVSLGTGATLGQASPGSWAAGDLICAGVLNYQAA